MAASSEGPRKRVFGSQSTCAHSKRPPFQTRVPPCSDRRRSGRCEEGGERRGKGPDRSASPKNQRAAPPTSTRPQRRTPDLFGLRAKFRPSRAARIGAGRAPANATPRKRRATGFGQKNESLHGLGPTIGCRCERVFRRPPSDGGAAAASSKGPRSAGLGVRRAQWRVQGGTARTASGTRKQRGRVLCYAPSASFAPALLRVESCVPTSS